MHSFNELHFCALFEKVCVCVLARRCCVNIRDKNDPSLKIVYYSIPEKSRKECFSDRRQKKGYI